MFQSRSRRRSLFMLIMLPSLMITLERQQYKSLLTARAFSSSVLSQSSSLSSSSSIQKNFRSTSNRRHVRKKNNHLFYLKSSFLSSPSFNEFATVAVAAHNNNNSNNSVVENTDNNTNEDVKLINLHTIPVEELEQIIVSWGYPKYRAKQIYDWVRKVGIKDINDMNNLPKKLRTKLNSYATLGFLKLDIELISQKDGTKKRAYRLHDNQLIESVLMPYDDGRYTACISSQAGCAMGCVFCATGQMGFARQLSSDEIFEQVSRFHTELKTENKRLSNIVFMGMGEPLANYRNVKGAINRITKELGIGARRITVSTVGVVPNIKKIIYDEDLPQIKLAISLHCATDEDRTALLPANKRYGGLDELMITLKEYIDVTNRRLTLEWALIEGENDKPEVAHQLGRLVKRFNLRRDMVHVNVIPLNPTGGYPQGTPSGRKRVDEFCSILENEYNIKCTPRMRRGIDINAGCGQLKSSIEKKEQQEKEKAKKKQKAKEKDNDDDERSPVRDFKSFMDNTNNINNDIINNIGVYDDVDDYDDDDNEKEEWYHTTAAADDDMDTDTDTIYDFDLSNSINIDEEDFDDPEFESEFDLNEAKRLIELVQNNNNQFSKNNLIDNNNNNGKDDDEQSSLLKTSSKTSTTSSTTTSITDEKLIIKAKKRRKKLIKNIKSINKLKDMEKNGKIILNNEQRIKISKHDEWLNELESVEHNLK